MSDNAWDQGRPSEAYDRWRVVVPTNWAEYQAEIRRDLAMMLEEELRPEVHPRALISPEAVLDRAIAIVKGEDHGRT